MTVEAFFIIIAASIAIIWGYYIDRVDRKKILFLSMIVWIGGAIICTLAPNWIIYIIGRIIMATGLGAQMPATYSIVADIIPSKYWSTLYGSLALLTAFSNGVGNFLSGFLAPMNIWGLGWQFPFALLSLISVVCFLLLILVKIPGRGTTALSELKEKIEVPVDAYKFKIKREDLKPLWKVDTNRWMLISCFFAVIPGATAGAFLIYYMKLTPFLSFPVALRTQTASIFAAMVGIGYLIGTLIFGPLFDKLHEKSKRARTKYTYIGLLIAIPMLILGFLSIVPVNYASLNLVGINPNDASIELGKYIQILTQIFKHYPSYGLFFLFVILGGMFASPMNINRTPTLLEINLPEHAGSSQAILNFSDQLGRGVTSLILAFEVVIFGFLFHYLDGRILLIISVLFYIPPIIYWRKISLKIEKEIEEKNTTLLKRTKELEIISEDFDENIVPKK